MGLNNKKFISMVLLIVSAIIFLAAIIVGAIRLIAHNESLRYIDFTLFLVGFLTLFVSNILKLTIKKDR